MLNWVFLSGMGRFLFFGLMLFACSAIADVEYFGGPTRKMIFVDLSTQVPAAPLQIAGTVNPPSLALNGKTIALAPILAPPSHKDSGDKVWVNGKPVLTSDTMGRFFLQLTGKDSAVETVEVVILSGDGKYFRSVLPINRVFIDAPISLRQVLPEEGNLDKTEFEFDLSGPVPTKLDFKIKRATKKTENGITHFYLKLPMGKSTIAATIREPGATRRILNIPVEVTKTLYSEKTPALALEYEGAIPDILELSKAGWSVTGATNPDATLAINGKAASVDATGRFAEKVIVNGETKQILFDVKLKNGTQQVFVKSASCAECKMPDQSGTTPIFAEIQLEHSSMMVFSGSNIPGQVMSFTPPVRPMFGVAVGKQLKDNFDLHARFSIITPLNGDAGDPYTIYVTDYVKLAAGATYYPLKWVGAGVDLSLINAGLSYMGFSYYSPYTNHFSAIGLSPHIEGRIRLSSRLNYVPRLEVDTSAFAATMGPGFNWTNVTLELIGLRYEL